MRRSGVALAVLCASGAVASPVRSFVACPDYVSAEAQDWSVVRAAARPTGLPQRTVHIPLGLPESDAVVYGDPAFNVFRLPVPADLKTRDKTSSERIRAVRPTVLAVALGEAPFVVDWRQTVWSRRPGGAPIVRGEVEAMRRHYAFEYCTDPADGELYVRVSVRNTGPDASKSVVRLRRSNPLESEVFDYQYVGFDWDASRWRTGSVLPPPACVSANGWKMSDEPSWDFPDEAYAMSGFICGSPYFVRPHLRLKSGGGARRFEADLQPGEERSFVVCAGFAAKPPAKAKGFDEVCAAAERFWRSRRTVRADFGDARENDVFVALQHSTLQLLLNPWNDPAATCLQPCQGGTSERFYVWVWEAMCELRPMIRLGYSREVSKVLEFILRLQDAGCPPEGSFTTTRGAIGTTGPRWANTTGSALLLASEYLTLTDDEAFAARHLENLLRAARWILGEVRATRTGDGPGCGLMPECVANDGDRGRFFTYTDSWSCAGVCAFAELLNRRGHPAAKEIEAESSRYRADLVRTVNLLQTPDGDLPRCVGEGGSPAFSFRNMPWALELLSSGALSPVSDEALVRTIRRWERVGCDRTFVEPMDAYVKYVGNDESALARAYLQRGEWKRAALARATFMNYALTRDLGVTSERYCETDAGFAPWQPNASNNGRGLAMMIDRFLLEDGATRVLLGGFAPYELGDVSIAGLKTREGDFSLTCRQGRLQAAWSRPLAAGTCLRVPEHFRFEPEGNALEACGKGTWRTTGPVKEVVGRLAAE